MGKSKTALHVALTLGLVSVFYGSPWILAATGAVSPRMVLEPYEVEQDRFAEVVWTPPEPPAEVVQEAPDAAQSSSEAASNESTTAPTLATHSPVGTPISGLTGHRTVAKVGPAVVDKAAVRNARRVVRRARVARPPRELTKKQERRRKRRKRVRDRLAKQPQCHELIDQIVPVAEGEWWVGQDLVGCYRAHPRQFMRMGGMQWVEDNNDKRVGLRIYVSSKSRGDVARAVGFKRGDVLRSLNGVPLRSTAGSGFAMMQLLGKRAKLKFLRNGKEHRVVLRVVGDGKLERARAELAAQTEG